MMIRRIAVADTIATIATRGLIRRAAAVQRKKPRQTLRCRGFKLAAQVGGLGDLRDHVKVDRAPAHSKLSFGHVHYSLVIFAMSKYPVMNDSWSFARAQLIAVGCKFK
jgi:hypothetical protein